MGGLLALGLLALTGCRHTDDRTSLLVLVTAPEFQPGVELDGVVVDVTLGQTVTRSFPVTASQGFPIHLAVVPAAGPGETVWIKVTGTLAGHPVTNTGAHVGFVAGQVRVLTLTLLKACSGVACPDARQACAPAGAGCAALPDVAAASLPTGPATPRDGAAEGPAGDAGLDRAGHEAGGDAAGEAGVETGVEAGGDAGGDADAAIVTLAENGQPCRGANDCKSTFCVDSVCCTKPAAQCAGCFACNIGGKGECAPVTVGLDPHATCPAGGSTCSGDGTCSALPPSCSDTAKNGNETDLNCGGKDCAKCAAGRACSGAADCQSGVCSVKSVCVGTTCENGLKDTAEADLDCGGACPTKCAVGAACGVAADCASGACNATSKKCVATHCEDGVTDGGESDVDCGAGCATKCDQGRACAANADCGSQVCSKAKVCVASRCQDGFQNGDEIDIDCGGPTCTARCGAGANCVSNGDCGSGACSTANKCVGSACFNGRKDADETDLDCGGVCATKCVQGKRCNGAGDCAGGKACVNGVCCGGASCPACQRCDLNGAGTCSAVAPGTADATCAVTCGSGACGSNGACAPLPSGSACGPFTCANGAEQAGQWSAATYRNKVCDGLNVGAAACKNNPSVLSCGNNVCADGSTCRTTCVLDADCVAGTHCESNQCVGPKGEGTACTEGIECVSRVCGFDYDLGIKVCVKCYSTNSCPLGTASCEPTGTSGRGQCVTCANLRGGGDPSCLPDGSLDCRTAGCTARATDCNQSTGHCQCGTMTAGCAIGMFCISGACKVGALQPCVRDDCAYGACRADGICGPSASGQLCTGDYSFAECEGGNSCGYVCH